LKPQYVVPAETQNSYSETVDFIPGKNKSKNAGMLRLIFDIFLPEYASTIYPCIGNREHGGQTDQNPFGSVCII
jgi:hypothetical protein